MSNSTTYEIESIKSEIAELDAALDATDDGAKATRLRQMIEGRRAQLRELRRAAREGDR